MKKIFDSKGYPVNLSFIDLKNFDSPFIIKDTLKKKEVEPNIKIYENVKGIKVLDEINFVLYAIPITKKKSWAKRQNKILFIRQKDMPVEEDVKVLKKLPSNHLIEIDIANRKLRLVGDFIHPNKKHTEWFYY